MYNDKMITLKIDNDEQTIFDQVLYMESIIDKLQNGFTSGINWKIEGEEVCQECGGTGEVSEDETDREGNIMRGVGSRACACRNKNKSDE